MKNTYLEYLTGFVIFFYLSSRADNMLERMKK